MKAILLDHSSKFLSKDLDDVFRITVRRSHIWEDSVRTIRRTFDERKHFRVAFLGESAIDGGGPRREFFMLLMNNIRENNSLLNSWASEASPTLGCSIEITRDIYLYIYMSVCLSWSKKA